MITARRWGLGLAAAVLVLAVIGPLLTPDAFDALAEPLASPSGSHWFGTDPFGRDVFARLALGARVSLMVALLAIALAGAIGVLLGVVAGSGTGFVARAIGGVIDLALALPRVVVLLVLVTATGTLGPLLLGVVLGATGWPAIARLVRGEALRMSHAGHVAAATALGASRPRVLWREILPGTLPAALVALTLGVADVLLLEAGLSFLGIGIRPPAPTWGSMILESQSYLASAPWLLLAPSVALVAATAAATLLGDALRARLQPGGR
jgi:peptide/nickel transport system permease protein